MMFMLGKKNKDAATAIVNRAMGSSPEAESGPTREDAENAACDAIMAAAETKDREALKQGLKAFLSVQEAAEEAAEEGED